MSRCINVVQNINVSPTTIPIQHRLLTSRALHHYYSSAQECTARKIKIEKEKNGKELTIANGSKLRTLG